MGASGAVKRINSRLGLRVASLRDLDDTIRDAERDGMVAAGGRLAQLGGFAVALGNSQNKREISPGQAVPCYRSKTHERARVAMARSAKTSKGERAGRVGGSPDPLRV